MKRLCREKGPPQKHRKAEELVLTGADQGSPGELCGREEGELRVGNGSLLSSRFKLPGENMESAQVGSHVQGEGGVF